jgi:hypothetical protein
MKLFAISALVAALATTTVSAQTAQNVIKDTTLSVTAIAGPLDFTIEGNRNGATELEVGFSAFDHSYGGVDAGLRFALGTDLGSASDLYARIEYNFGSEVVENLAIYGSAALQYETDTELSSGVIVFDPSVGASYAITSRVGIFAEVGYAWELNNAKADRGGYVEVGVPFAVTEQLYVTPSVSRSFRTGANETAAHLNLTIQF